MAGKPPITRWNPPSLTKRPEPRHTESCPEVPNWNFHTLRDTTEPVRFPPSLTRAIERSLRDRAACRRTGTPPATGPVALTGRIASDTLPTATHVSYRVLGPGEEKQLALGIVDRPDPKPVHECRSILAVIQYVDREAGFGPQAVPDGLYGIRACLGALQEPAIVPDRLVRAVRGLGLELVAHENHRVVGQGGIREHDTHFGFIRFEQVPECVIVHRRSFWLHLAFHRWGFRGAPSRPARGAPVKCRKL